MPNSLTRQLDRAEQQKQQSRSQMARTVAADQGLVTQQITIDRQLQELSQAWQTAHETQNAAHEPLQDIENYRRFLIQQKQHLQSQRHQLAKQLAIHRAEVLHCEQRLRLLQRRDQQRQQRQQRLEQQSHAQLLDRFSRQCVQVDALASHPG